MQQRIQPPEYRPVKPPSKPVVFPAEEKRMENKWHRLVCRLLYDLLNMVLGGRALLAWDQFLYWDASDPRKNVGPDIFGRTGEKDRIFRTWKTWELGVPEFVFEVVSDYSWPDDVADKPAIYDRLGVKEVVVFDPEPETRRAAAGWEPRVLRAWRRIEGSLVEVELEGHRYFLETLGVWVRAVPADGGRWWLRLAQGQNGDDLVPVPEEQAALKGRAEGRAEGTLRVIRRVLERLGLEPDEPFLGRLASLPAESLEDMAADLTGVQNREAALAVLARHRFNVDATQ